MSRSSPRFLSVAGHSRAPTPSTGSERDSSNSGTSSGASDLLAKMLREDALPIGFDKQLSALPTNAERVDLMYSHMKRYLKDVTEDVDEKSDELSRAHQADGDRHFEAGNYLQAYMYYCKGVATAKTELGQAHAYGKRVRVLAKWKVGGECAIDANRAVSIPLAPELEIPLRKESDRSRRIGDREEPYFTAIPSIPDSDKHPDLEGLANCVKIKHSKKYGQHLVATRDIELGEVVGVLEPLVFTIFDNNFFHCDHCARLLFNPIPCELCTEAFYCSRDCRKWSKPYHKYECIITRKVEKMTLRHRDSLSLKLAYLMRNHYANIENVQASDKTSPSIGFRNLYNMPHHLNHLPSDTMMSIIFYGTYVYHVLKNYTDFFNVPEQEKAETKFKELILINRAIVDCNSVRISEMANIHDKNFNLEDFGLGLYQMMSLINHACNPNVTSIFYGTTLVLKVLVSVRKGEQLFVSYGVRYDMQSIYFREIILDGDYKFNCRCRACCEDWPTFKPHSWLLRKHKSSKKVLKLTKREKIEKAYYKCREDFRKYEISPIPTDVFTVKLRAFEYCLQMQGNLRRMAHPNSQQSLWKIIKKTPRRLRDLRDRVH